jgi:hypothetical protein
VAPDRLGPASSRVLDSLDPVAASVSGRPGRRLATVVEELRSPLTVAIAGRVKAGKSTLVNAVLGRAVAPTGATECTKVVTSFQRGAADQLTARLSTGERRKLQLVNGQLPAELGLPVDSVERLEARLTSRMLDRMVLVDTPGLSTLRTENAERTSTFLGLDPRSAESCARADAVIFVTNHIAHADETEALRQFVVATGQRSSLATVAVLGQADRAGDAAARLAQHQLAELRGLVSDVIPVSGLLAQAFRCGLFTEDDADAVTALAALPADERGWLLEDRAEFLQLPAGSLSTAARQRLLTLIDFPGVQLAVAAALAGARRARDLEQALLEVSNFPLVEKALGRFAQRADALKVSKAVAAVESVAFGADTDPADRLRLTEIVATLRAAPELHVLAELEVLEEVLRGSLPTEPGEAEELRRLLTPTSSAARLGLPASTDEAEVRNRAREEARRWQLVRATARGSRRRHLARVVTRTYRLIADTDTTQLVGGQS